MCCPINNAKFLRTLLFKKKKRLGLLLLHIQFGLYSIINSWVKKNLDWGGRKFIFNGFSRDILFSSLFFFFFYFFVLLLVFLLVCFLKLKIYILKHIRLCGRVSDKYFFIRSFFRNKTTFLGLVSKHVYVDSSIQQKIKAKFTHILFVQKQLVLQDYKSETEELQNVQFSAIIV